MRLHEIKNVNSHCANGVVMIGLAAFLFYAPFCF